ncbi:DMT family transporter [Acinetobacter sp. WU_MDCI_Abxc222]|uniref:DMT family transporter n=1 Tax=Acinetobacter sp. WU_MDCI_Abxc222 TaxID=2850076 RepID=UPI0021CDAD9E|nr:DMT family transporter [Acinetobacter sp. WU_MDCI_Abxc222]
MENNLLKKSQRLIYIKLSLVSMIWGGTFVAGRYISSSIPPLMSASFRFLIASVILTFFLIFFTDGFKKIDIRQLLTITALGFCGVYTYNALFFYGLNYIDASRASLIVASNPPVMALLGYLFYKEKISWLKFIGIILCVLGASIVIFGKSPDLLLNQRQLFWLGDILIFGCVLSWAAYSIFCKKIVNEIGPLYTVTYSIYAGTVMLFITALLMKQINFNILSQLTFSSVISLFYLGALGSALGFIWYYDGIQKIGATRASVFIALNPLTAVLLGALVLHEKLSFSTLIGGALIIVGIILCNKVIVKKI